MEIRTSCAQKDTNKIIYLRNGVRQGNPNQNSLRCGAQAKSTGKPCQGMAVRGKERCRLHGGRSTGPITTEGRAKCGDAKFIHGSYSRLTKDMIKLNKLYDG